MRQWQTRGREAGGLTFRGLGLYLSPLAPCPLPDIWLERDLRDSAGMATLRKHSLEQYLRARFGSGVTLLSYEVIGKASSKGAQKQYGYGTPVKLTFRVGQPRAVCRT